MNIQPYPIQIFQIIPGSSCVEDNPIGLEYYPKFLGLDISQKKKKEKKKEEKISLPLLTYPLIIETKDLLLS